MRSTSEHRPAHAADVSPPAGSAIRLPRDVADRLVEHAHRAYPAECCGSLIGRPDGAATIVQRCFPAENIAQADRRRSYQIDWRSLFNAFREARAAGLRVVGFYHSHPDGSAEPSVRDQAEAWIDHPYLIVSLHPPQRPRITCWRRRGDQTRMLPQRVEIEDHPGREDSAEQSVE